MKLIKKKNFLRCVLFEAVLELKVNLGKFELVPLGDVLREEALAAVLCFRVPCFPFKYLGLL
jgi:hypothetical protein